MSSVISTYSNWRIFGPASSGQQRSGRLKELPPELVATSGAEEGASARSPSQPGGHLRPLCSAVNVGTLASLSSSGEVPSAESPVEYKGGNGLQPTDAKP